MSKVAEVGSLFLLSTHGDYMAFQDTSAFLGDLVIEDSSYIAPAAGDGGVVELQSLLRNSDTIDAAISNYISDALAKFGFGLPAKMLIELVRQIDEKEGA